MAKTKTKSETVTGSTDPVTDYARGVVAGAILAGPYVRAAARRHLNDLETGPARGLRWNIGTAQRALGFFPDVLRVEAEPDPESPDPGTRAGLPPFRLLPCWEFVVGSIFGWQRRDGDGWVRRFRKAYVEAGKGSGKTPTAAGVGLYCMVAEGELSAECYAAAAKRDQAMILFTDVVKMVDRSPHLKHRLVRTGKKTVYQLTHHKTGSIFKPLSADKKKSGQRVYFGGVDELHEHRDRYTIDMLEQGFKRRRQPLLFVITNSGFDRESICWEWHENACAIVEGLRDDDTFFSFVMSLDDTDDPLEDESCWPKTNPGIGITVTREYLRSQVADARSIPGREPGVRRLNFCEWCVAPDTLITLASGKRKRADELQPGETILAFDEKTGRLVKALVGIVKDNGEHQIFRISTARGRSVDVTEEHRFWSRSGRAEKAKYGWIRAGDLRRGDRVAVALGRSLPLGSRFPRADLARFLGIMVGDGTCNGSPLLTNIDPGVIGWCSEFAEKNKCKLIPAGDGYHWRFQHAEKHNGRRTTQGLQTPIKYILKRHEMWRVTSYTKRVPSMIERGGPAVWAAFLSGYLDTDGDVGPRHLRWTSCNRPLLADCQHLLALLGVQASLNSPRPKSFRLEVRDAASLVRASELLTPIHSKKRVAVAALAKVKSDTDRADAGKFDRVSSVEVLPPGPTIGIEVEEFHTHVTNGLITHNTDAEIGWVTRAAWAACEDETLTSFVNGAGLGYVMPPGALEVAKKLRVRPRTKKPTGFEGARCTLGLDMSYAFDLTALAVAFAEGDDICAWIEYFTPRETAAEREKTDRVPYLKWIDEGLIHGVPGKVVRKEFIARRVAEIAGKFDVEWAAFDRYRHKELREEMIELGVDVPWIEHPQGFRRAGQLDLKGADGKKLDNPLWMPESIRELEQAVLEHRLHVTPSPVTRWQISSIAVRDDPAGTGNKMFDKAKAVGRIDGPVALAMAVGALSMRLPVMSLKPFMRKPVMVT